MHAQYTFKTSIKITIGNHNYMHTTKINMLAKYTCKSCIKITIGNQKYIHATENVSEKNMGILYQ